MQTDLTNQTSSSPGPAVVYNTTPANGGFFFKRDRYVIDEEQKESKNAKLSLTVKLNCILYILSML